VFTERAHLRALGAVLSKDPVGADADVTALSDHPVWASIVEFQAFLAATWVLVVRARHDSFACDTVALSFPVRPADLRATAVNTDAIKFLKIQYNKERIK